MYAISIVFLASCIVRVIAEKTGKFSLPIERTDTVLPGIIPSFPNQYDGIQKPLNIKSKSALHAAITEKDSQSRGRPVETQNFIFYTTNISIGTPPQSFRAIVDLNWSDLFIPSSTCGSRSPRYCNPTNATYNASASSTYHDNGTITAIAYDPVYAYARLSEDTLTFAGGLQVPRQVFHEIKYYEDVGAGFGAEFFDGVLGLSVEKPWLARPQADMNILPSPFRSMIDYSLLDINMFSIVWPTEAREQGNLIFGGYDEDLLDGELVSHPLFPEDTTKWQVEIESVSMTSHTGRKGKEVLVNKPLPQGKAFFMSPYPSLAFPYDLAESLIRQIDSWPSSCSHYRIVDCDEVPSLPEITISLRGQNVTLRGENYVRKIEPPKNCLDFEAECHLMIDYLPEFEDVVFLGIPFLEKVMGIWNWDEKTVSFGELKK